MWCTLVPRNGNYSVRLGMWYLFNECHNVCFEIYICNMTQATHARCRSTLKFYVKIFVILSNKNLYRKIMTKMKIFLRYNSRVIKSFFHVFPCFEMLTLDFLELLNRIFNFSKWDLSSKIQLTFEISVFHVSWVVHASCRSKTKYGYDYTFKIQKHAEQICGPF